MSHQAKAASAGSTEAGGSARGLLRLAFVVRASREDSDGSGAPGARPATRLRATLAVFALAIVGLALTTAPASAASLSSEMGAISEVSYTFAHVTGRVSSPGCSSSCFINYSFQYSKNPATEGWSAGPGGSLGTEPVENLKLGRDITGLKGGTQYFVRLSVTFLSFSPFSTSEVVSPEPPDPYPSFTTLTVDPPTIPGTVGTSPTFSLSATAVGKIKRPANPNAAFNVNCRFEYVTDEQFSATGFEGATVVACAQNPITEPNVDKDVSADLAGLTSATTYHLRLAAENSAPGEPVVKDGTFTTQPTVAKPVVLAANDPTDISYKFANFTGEVERPAGADPALNTYCYIEYVTAAQFEATGFDETARAPCDQTVDDTGEQYPLTTAGPTPITPFQLGFKSGETYHVRLGAQNAGGLTTKDFPSTVTTLPGGESTYSIDEAKAVVGYTTFEVFGTVKRGLGTQPDESIGYNFEFAEVGTENWANVCCYNQKAVPTGSGPQTIFYKFNKEFGVTPDTEYKYRFSLNYAEFTPEPYPTVKTRSLTEPAVTFDPVTGVTANTAQFSGTVDPQAPSGTLDALGKAGYKTEWELQCTPKCPDPGDVGTVEGEEGKQTVSFEDLRLQANTYYEAKLVAHNEYYTVESPVQTFQTPLVPPSVESADGGSDEQGGYFIQGIVNSNNSKVTNCRFEYGTTSNYPNTYQAPCLPSPSGPNEVQQVNVDATEGEFRLSFRGQTTEDLAFNATPAAVQAALRALSKVGPNGVNVSGTPQAYTVTFAGSLAGANVEPLKFSDGAIPLAGGAGASGSTTVDGGIDHAVSIEAHLENLTIGATYHFRIFAANAAGTTSSVDRIFIPTIAAKGPVCPNEELRAENESLGLPECRAYEMVTFPNKEGASASFVDFNGGDAVAYWSAAANLANSGQSVFFNNSYVSRRTADGWETIPDLNGPTGSWKAPPTSAEFGDVRFYSKDLRSSIWRLGKDGATNPYIRRPDGQFELIGRGGPFGIPWIFEASAFGASDDLSHFVSDGETMPTAGGWGPGVYEFVGTGNDQPRRVDIDNTGHPPAHCGVDGAVPGEANGAEDSFGNVMSDDGSVIVFTSYGDCVAANPPVNELWARVDGTTTYHVSGSQCDRAAADPGGECNGPVDKDGCVRDAYRTEVRGCHGAHFQGASKDGSRIYFTTARQVVNSDIDEGNDLYACDLPATPQPPVGTSNPCAATLLVSTHDAGKSEMEQVLSVSDDGSSVYFTAKGVLADNEDALGKEAASGDLNLYVWRTDAAHPAGETTFVASLPETDSLRAQTTPDGSDLVFQTKGQLVLTDTDEATDVYRYDADTGEMSRVSIGVSGTGGNADFDAGIGRIGDIAFNPRHNSHSAISDDGELIVFLTQEPLSPLDGNGEPDAYLWKDGRVLGSVAAVLPGYIYGQTSPGQAFIDGSGKDIYIETGARLTASDIDSANDVYDVRVDGGFAQRHEGCAGSAGACQSDSSEPAPAPVPVSSQPPVNPGNVVPMHCPKGKVVKGTRCVKKPHAKHGKKHHKKKKRRSAERAAGHGRGDSK